MIGGIRFEHTHRVIASFVGLLMLCLAIWLHVSEKRHWVKVLGYCAFGSVVLQGVLGGITVLLFLPKFVSISHAILAQTFFVLTIIIAYSLSKERGGRSERDFSCNKNYLILSLLIPSLVFLQLFLGALMRHTASGLAIPDFPEMGGQLFPRFDHIMLATINARRFDMNLSPVTVMQVVIHFIHRAMAVIIFMGGSLFVYETYKSELKLPRMKQTALFFTILIFTQIFFGILTILSGKQSLITSLHVAVGAIVLGFSVLMALRAFPRSIKDVVQIFKIRHSFHKA